MLPRRTLKWLACCLPTCIAAIAATGAGAAPIRVVTFTGLPKATAEWIEDGIRVQGVAIGFDATPGVAHLEACCTEFADRLDITTGSLFRPISLKLDPIESGFCEDPSDPSCGHDDPMPYIRISAFKGSVPVAWTTFYVPGSTPTMTLSLVDVLGPIEVDLLGIQALSFQGSRSRFEIDDVTLELVPEPSTAALLVPGLVALAMRRRRARLRAAR